MYTCTYSQIRIHAHAYAYALTYSLQVKRVLFADTAHQVPNADRDDYQCQVRDRRSPDTIGTLWASRAAEKQKPKSLRQGLRGRCHAP